MQARYYLLINEQPYRLSRSVLAGLNPLFQLAGSKQRYVQILFEWREGALFSNVTGHFLTFDERGFVSNEGYGAATSAAWDYHSEERRARASKIPDLNSLRSAKAKVEAFRWNVDDDLRRKVALSILPTSDPRRDSVKWANTYIKESKA